MMKVEEIVEAMEAVGGKWADKAKAARGTAAKARRRGDSKKWDKFNAIARVYEMACHDLMPLSAELMPHTPEEYQSAQLSPFG